MYFSNINCLSDIPLVSQIFTCPSFNPEIVSYLTKNIDNTDGMLHNEEKYSPLCKPMELNIVCASEI